MRLVLPRRSLTPLWPDQAGAVERLCAADPVAGVLLVHQVRRWQAWGKGDLVGVADGGRAWPSRTGHDDAAHLGDRQAPGGVGGLRAAAWSTGSLMPFGVAGSPEHGLPGIDAWQVRALAEHAGRRLTRHGSVFGPVRDVERVWRVLAAGGTRSREERWRQPLLAAPELAGGLTAVSVRRRPRAAWAAAGLRAATGQDMALLEPAAVAMFRQEVGDDPLATPSQAASYRASLRWLVERGRTYVLLDDGAGDPPRPFGGRRVVFKTDVGALWPQQRVAQLTGVWTHPDLRGRGIGAAALAAVVDAVRRDHLGGAGTVSLYVNDFNTAALGLYRSLGFRQVGMFATVLL